MSPLAKEIVRVCRPPRAALPAATLLSLFLAAVLPSAKESRTRRRLDRAANVLSETLLYLFFAGAGAAGGVAGACLVDAGPALLAFLGILYAGHALMVYGCAEIKSEFE